MPNSSQYKYWAERVKKPKRCPLCGQETIADIFYGVADPKTKELAKAGKVILVRRRRFKEDPVWKCTTCNLPIFRKHPVLMFDLENFTDEELKEFIERTYQISLADLDRKTMEELFILEKALKNDSQLANKILQRIKSL